MSDSNFVFSVTEIDAQTADVNERPFTDDELNDYNAFYLSRQNEMQSVATAYESALAKLAKLGLTAEEIAAL